MYFLGICFWQNGKTHVVSGLRKTHGLSLVEPWRAEAALGTPSGGQWKWTLGLSLDDLKKDGFGGRSLVLARAPASLLSKAREKLVRY